ncbi:MAG: dipeptidase [Anaerolinea sp.]|nr:dipeptidase [Anaerolinea sp.]
MKLTIISDPAVKIIPIKECGEQLVNLATWREGFQIDFSRKQIASRSDHFSKIRLRIAEKLFQARQLLPEQYDFLIKECYRPPERQEKSFTIVLEYIKKKYDTLSEEQQYNEACKICAPLDVAPHPTGAAVDLTLIEKHTGEEIDMGTAYNATPLETNNATFLNAANISKEAQRMRSILKETLYAVGLVNYEPEWWHWSYGDKYWAFQTNQEYALFGIVRENDIEV